MPRTSRMIIPDEKAVYHVISRTALPDLPFGDVEKEQFVKILKRLSKVYFTEIIGYCMMSNHFHLLVRMHPGKDYSDTDIKERYKRYYGDDKSFPMTEEGVQHFRKKWEKLSDFVQEIKQSFSRYYNRMHNRRGTLWAERFKSVIVQNGESLLNCLAYIDLNPVRAGIVQRPESYRWCSIGHHAQTENKDGFLSTDFGLVEFGNCDEQERFRRYRRYVYEEGASKRSDDKSKQVISQKTLNKERDNDFEISKTSMFLNKSRYFTDSGVIGSKEFVSENYQRFKHLFTSKHEKKPKPIKGISGLYSLKRLSI